MSPRYSDTNNIVHKQLSPTVKAYENWRECETLERLESIKDNPNAIHMESLVIRERILGRCVFRIDSLKHYVLIYIFF